MKRTKFFAGALALIFAMSLGLASCSNDDDNNNTDTGTTDTDNTAEALESAAFNLLRALCDLAQYDPDAVQLEGDADYIGVDTLPENWKKMKFTLDEGVVLDDTKPLVRSIAAPEFGYALDYFSDIIGTPLTKDDLTGGTYEWNYSGLGKLTFRSVSGEDDDAYAVIDFDVSILDVSQLRFVPAEVIEGENAANSYSGEPYFSAGDIIFRNKDNTYWLCVRPAGGPMKKDKSYWMCLTPFKKNGDCIISQTKETITRDDSGTKVKQTWVFAKNLMSLKTAKAAYHTLNALTNEDCFAIYTNAETVYNGLTNLSTGGWDLRGLRDEGNEEKDDEEEDEGTASVVDYDDTFLNIRPVFSKYGTLGEDKDNYSRFTIAYGSVTKDKLRTTSGKAEKINAYTQYVQPVLIGTADVSGKVVSEAIVLHATASYNGRLFSATDGYDFLKTPFGEAYKNIVEDYENALTSIRPSLSARALANASDAYDFTKFVQSKVEGTGAGFSAQAETRLPQLKSIPQQYTEGQFYDNPVIFSPELCIKDNQGSTSNRVCPIKAAEYAEVFVAKNIINGVGDSYFDWWKSLESTTRTVDGKEVSWKSENN